MGDAQSLPSGKEDLELRINPYHIQTIRQLLDNLLGVTNTIGCVDPREGIRDGNQVLQVGERSGDPEKLMGKVYYQIIYPMGVKGITTITIRPEGKHIPKEFIEGLRGLIIY